LLKLSKEFFFLINGNYDKLRICIFVATYLLMYKIFFTLISFFLVTSASAQKNISVKGSAKTDDGKPLTQASVSIYYAGTKDTLKTITNDKGAYSFNNVLAKKVMISISYVGYKRFVDEYDFTNAVDEVINNDVVMTRGDNMLETVTVESSKIYIKEDTVSYRIDSTMYRKNDNVEQVLKNLPGVEVDKDGKVTAQGKEVTKVKVNGKEFFGGDVKTATRQLDADMVDKIQIVDDYGDQAAFTGVKDGDPTKTLNIQLKKDRNKGVFGNVTAGYGSDKRYSNAFNLNRFNNSQQISLTGNLNNTNESLFDFSRIPGGMGAIAGSMMRSFGGASSPFGNFGSSDGIGVTKTFGINYRDEWSKKVSVNGSYSFSVKDNNILNDVYQEYTASSNSGLLFNKQNTIDVSRNINHRFSYNIEYRIDSFNYIKFNPSFTLSKITDNYNSNFNYFNEKGNTLNSGINKDLNRSQTPNFTGSLLFNHRFHKKGRTLSVNLNSGISATDGNDDVDNINNFFILGVSIPRRTLQNVEQNNNNNNYSINASFNEQLSKKKALEFNYTFSHRYVGNDRETFDLATGNKVFVDSLSNIFENIYTINRFGANYRITQKKYNYAVGLAIQPATIASNTLTGRKLQYKQQLVNYFPVIRFAYNFSKSKSFNVNYNGSTNQPTFQQSQPVIDQTNLQNIIIGNPNLRPEFSNTFSTRFNNFNVISGDVMFANLTASFTKDKIVSDVTRKDNSGVQETRYLNENGFFTINGFYSFSKPIKNRKYVFNYGGNATFNNNISYLNTKKNTAKNVLLLQRFSMDYKIKKWLETSGGFSFSINESKNSLNTIAGNSIKTWRLIHSSRMFFKHDFNFSYDVTKALNNGYTSNVDANPLIVNATLEKQIFKNKNGAIKLQAFDLLNENTNVSRNVNANNITDTRTNRLQRYFMLSFVLRFNKFSGASKAGPGMMPGMPGGGRGEIRMMGGPGM
jgi:Outer membrane protein beta-barrel family/CarboxypepD_reg-like domain